ncbi:MAG: hypothetical protein ACYDH5_06630 [Acidimicrobiales bacterium]
MTTLSGHMQRTYLAADGAMVVAHQSADPSSAWEVICTECGDLGSTAALEDVADDLLLVRAIAERHISLVHPERRKVVTGLPAGEAR